MLGHAKAILVGWVSLSACGIARSPPVTITGFTDARIGAVALAVGITRLVLHVIVARHPLAGASALSVSTGILSTASLWSPRSPLRPHED